MNGFRRKIFYLSGYDPRGLRFYHQLYLDQARLYAERSGHDIAVGGRSRSGGGQGGWLIEDRSEGSSSDLTFLAWDDIVRETWGKNPLRLMWGAIVSTLSFTRAWDWRGFAHHIPRATFLAFYYPALVVLILPLLLIALIWLLAGPVAALTLGLAISFLVVRRTQGSWLLRFVIFNDRFSRDDPIPGLEQRMAVMADAIDAALAEDWDEVLFVTHSNGSALAVPMMARLLDRHGGRMPGNFALMTLGSCIPLIGIRKDARRFQERLDTVAQGDFLWLDLGSRTDGACIPLVDPCVTCATAHRPDMHVLSPRWFKYCDPATYRRRKRDKYATHFEYLRTFDRISPLDYLRVTSCGQPLSASIAQFAQTNA